jgi:hypothetical protein
MSAKILQFVSRAEQLRLRGMRNFSHWHSITKGFEPFGPCGAPSALLEIAHPSRQEGRGRGISARQRRGDSSEGVKAVR